MDNKVSYYKIIDGLNFVTETFGGFNEKAMYSRTELGVFVLLNWNALT